VKRMIGIENLNVRGVCTQGIVRDDGFIPIFTVSSPPAESRLITAAGFDPTHASSCPSPYYGACSAASSSPA